jgi:hypothetical protein
VATPATATTDKQKGMNLKSKLACESL